MTLTDGSVYDVPTTRSFFEKVSSLARAIDAKDDEPERTKEPNRYGYYTCPVCHGLKKCPRCSDGVASNPYLGGSPMLCSACGGSGDCPRCGKTGKVYGVVR